MNIVRRMWGGRARFLGLVLGVGILLVGGTVHAQSPSVDQLLARLFDGEGKQPYVLTADFTGSLVVTVRGSRLDVQAAGTVLEWRGTDGVRRRRVTIHRLDLPLLLRPFASTLRRTIEEKIEREADNPETFHAHDIFLLAELPGRQYVLAGVHRSIVDDAIARYGQPRDARDVATRRKIAQWLYTSPSMRDFLVRPGPPYAIRATVDDSGLLHDLVVSYDWGDVTTTVGYVTIGGQPVWASVTADTVTTLTGVGRVSGRLSLRLTNHCVNCPTAPGSPR
ncbi:MAG: hypothetical protein QN155_07720 [Armatimonadota bacterium]|nr:hypothetical protein [Armatimonadota bacterium]MDR7404563.1 hypothetical protein [Armatimonadota bacterium]